MLCEEWCKAILLNKAIILYLVGAWYAARG